MPRSLVFIFLVLMLLAPFSAVLAELATVEMTITLNGEPLIDPLHGKFYIYEEDKREQYLAWGHAEKSVRLTAGVYDIVVKYHRDHLRAQRTFSGVNLTGQVRRNVDFRLNPATLTLGISNGGRPVPRYVGQYSVHKAGQRGKPLASKRPGDTLVVAAGNYDIEVTYRDLGGLQSQWLLDYRIEGNLFETVEIGSSVARLRLTVTEDGLVSNRARYRLFRPGSQTNPIAEAASGAPVTVEAGVYDIALYRGSRSRPERWLTGVDLQGESEREETLSSSKLAIRIDCTRQGTVDGRAWFTVHPPGDPGTVVADGRSGSRADVAPGRYDLRCYSRVGSLRPENWLYDVVVEESGQFRIALSDERAVLRVLPAPGGGDTSTEAARLLMVLDSSFEMRTRMGGASRLDQASRAVRNMIDWGRDMNVEVGLRAFGITPRSQRDCRDSALLVKPGPIAGSRVGSTVDLLRPSGLSPLAYSLEQVVSDLPAGGNVHVVLVTGSAEGCGGNPCRTATQLIRGGRVERIDVIALDVDRDVENELHCVGRFSEARNRRELTAMLRELLRELNERPTGTFSVFTPGWSEWIGSAPLGRELELAAGRYDVLIKIGDRIHLWEAFDLHGAVEAVAGERPSR